jgi:hypothetical protein
MDPSLMTFQAKNDSQNFSRRTLLKSMGFAPLLLHSAPFYGASLLFDPPSALSNGNPGFPFSDTR